MHNKSSDTLSDEIIEYLSDYFKEKLGSFSVYNLKDEPYKTFNITFDAYNYFIITFSYNRGSIGCSISQGKYGLNLETSQKWYDQVDMDIFLKELEQQIELRIPDKFLEFHGWK